MKYYLAHNGNDVFNYGKIGEGQKIETGQPALEFFNSIEELELELSRYGVELPREQNPINPDCEPFESDEPVSANVESIE